MAGALAVTASVSGHQPLSLIGCYLPPPGSTYSHHRPRAQAWVEAEYVRLRFKFPTVAVLGDMNFRMGKTNPDGSPRFTADTATGSAPDRAWMLRMGILPVHGRGAGQLLAALLTSRPHCSAVPVAEVDYIAMDLTVPALPLPAQPWASIPSADGDRCIHRLVGISIPLSPGPLLPRHERGEQRPWYFGHYTDRRWKDAADALRSSLGPAATAASDPNASFAASYAVFDASVGAAMNTVFAKPEQQLRWTTFRRFRSITLPECIASEFASARALRSRARDVNRAGGGGDALCLSAGVVFRRARHLARKHWRAWMRGRATDLNVLRRKDPAAFHILLARAGPDVHLVQDAPRVSDPARVARHYSDLYAVRPPPPCVGDAHWEHFVPSAAAPDPINLASNFSVAEVWFTLFPLPRRAETVAWAPCCAQCARCMRFAGLCATWRGGGGPKPLWSSCGSVLHTARAAGPNGYPAEALRWSVPPPGIDADTHRFRMCTIISQLLNKLWDGGAPSVEFAENIITSLYKGQGDVNDPSNSRGIGIIAVLPKLLKVILTTRLSHWAAIHDIVSPAQIGFMPERSAEHHVFALHQLVMARMRHNEPTWLLFLDLSKAYDCVHPVAMAWLLRRMGVPERLVLLLERLQAARTFRVRVNGVLSPRAAMYMGLTQGDPLACLLWLFFIEPMMRYVASLNTLGAASFGETLKQLLYADDAVAAEAARAALESVVRGCHRWAVAFGMTINTNAGKTNAMLATRRAQYFPLPPPLRSSGATAAAGLGLAVTPPDLAISFTQQYKYLGLQTPTTFGQVVEPLRPRLITAFRASFSLGSVVHGASPMAQLQLFRTSVLGSASYLTSLAQPPRAELGKADAYITNCVRQILRLPRTASPSLVLAVSKLPPTQLLLLGQRVRMLLTLHRSPHQDMPASAVLRALAAEPPSPAASRGNWLVTTLDALTLAQQAYGVPVPAVDGPYARASLDAHLYTRELAVTMHRVKLAAAAAPNAVARGLSVTEWLAARPPTYGSTVHCAWLTHGVELGAALRVLLGELRGTTPLAVTAPMCSGSLLAMVDGDCSSYPRVALALCGAEALARRPFVREDEAAFHVAHPWAQFTARPCRLCAGVVLDVWHLALECPYPTLRRLSARRRAETLRLLSEVAIAAANAIRAGNGVLPVLTHGETAALAELRRGGGPGWAACDAVRAVLYLALLGVPWGPTRFPGHLGATALGKLFLAANVRQSHLRPLALSWLTFSEEALAELTTAWRAADAAPFRGVWEPAYLWRWFRDWFHAHVAAPLRRLLALLRRYAALLVASLAAALRRAFRRVAAAPLHWYRAVVRGVGARLRRFRRPLAVLLRWLRAGARRAAARAGAALLRCPRRAVSAGSRVGVAFQRAVRLAVAAGLLPQAANRHLLAARLAVWRYAFFYAIAFVPGLHFLFMP